MCEPDCAGLDRIRGRWCGEDCVDLILERGAANVVGVCAIFCVLFFCFALFFGVAKVARSL